MRPRHALLVPVALLPVAAAVAEGDFAFRVKRRGDVVGTHRVRFASRGAEHVAMSDLRITPKFLGVVVFRYEHRYEEVTVGGRFRRVTSRLNRDGRIVEVRGEAVPGAVLLDGTAGPQRLPADAAPLSWWEPGRLGGRVPLFGTTTGRPLSLAWERRRPRDGGRGIRLFRRGERHRALRRRRPVGRLLRPRRGRERHRLHPRMSGGTLRVVLGDQCSRGIAALDGLDPAHDTVLMMEVQAECTYVPASPAEDRARALCHAPFRPRAVGARHRGGLRAARRCRQYAELLGARCPAPSRRHRPARIIATHPGEWRVLQDMQGWQEATGMPVEIRQDTRFLCALPRFRAWAKGRRRSAWSTSTARCAARPGLLMDGDEPAGGQWNFDAENRRALPRDVTPPPPRRFPPDAITREVMALVAERFGAHFGDLDGFAWPVTAKDATAALDAFIRDRLPLFGDYQDAMAAGQPTMFHALVSTSLNAGLLDPMEACRAAEQAWRDGHAPLNAVEGFIRQILGWREYVRGIYWHFMPGYAGQNALGADRPLPGFYWGGDDHHALHGAGGGADARPRLRPPHPAADGHGQFRAARRASTRPR